MNPIETRDAIRQLVEKHRFKQAIERINKWGNANGNDWVASAAIRLLEDMMSLPKYEHVLLSDRILALAECIVTGGFPETSGVEVVDLSGKKGNATSTAAEMSPEMSGASDNFAEISESIAPAKSEAIKLPTAPIFELPKKKAAARPSKNSGSAPSMSGASAPTSGSKSKPVFSASLPSKAVAIEPIKAAAATFESVKPTVQTGGLLYNIPSKMQQNQDTTCIVRIAFDKTQLKTSDDTFTEEVVKDIRVSRLMEVEMENEGTEEVFKIVAKSEKQQSLDTFEATEWRFAVRPLQSGTHSLLLKVTIVETDENGKETRKEKILEEEIAISTQKVKNTEGSLQGFLSADLKLSDLKTLLFMGANPPGTRTLQLEVEHSRIATKINNRFRIEVEKFLSAAEIPELIIDKKPAIIHFSGHGKDPNSSEQGETDGTTRAIGRIKKGENQGGIVVFDDDMRGLKVVDDEALDFIFENITTNFETPIEVVVFNSCYSESQAKVIGKYVPYVVGSARAIADDVAIAFASGFYFGMSKGLTVEKAFASGKMQAVLADKKARDLIVLYKDGVKVG